MIGTPLRPAAQKLLLDPVATVLSRNPRLSPNTITLLSMICGIGVLPALMSGQRGVAIALVVLTGYLDCLDGALARMTQKSSPLGATFDSVADRLVDVALLLGLFSVDVEGRAWATLSMLGSLYVNMSTYLIISVFTRFRNDKGYADLPSLMERSESFLFIFIMILVPSWFHVLAWLYTVLTLATAGQRLLRHVRQMRRERPLGVGAVLSPEDGGE